VRTEARIRSSIWADEDFVALTADAKLLYFAMLSQPTLSLCGVLPLPGRLWGGLTGLNRDRSQAAFEDLIEDRFILVDEDAEEVCIRTFIKHDEVLKQPWVIVGMTNDFQGIRSHTLQDHVLDVLGEDFLARLPELLGRVYDSPSYGGLPEGFTKAFVERFGEGSTKGLRSKGIGARGNQRGVRGGTDADTPEFVAFWDAYPLKRDKPAGRKAYAKAVLRASADEILAGAWAYRDDPNRDEGYTRWPSTWLNGDGWLDPPLPVRRSSRGRDPDEERQRASRVLDAVAAQKQVSQPPTPQLQRGAS
jgi:hypothetical protein